MAETSSVIIGSGVIVTGSTMIRDVHEGKIRAAPIVFGFMMVIALLVISMGSQKTARGLAYMALVGAFVVNGPAVFAITSGISKSSPPGSGKGTAVDPFAQNQPSGKNRSPVPGQGVTVI